MVSIYILFAMIFCHIFDDFKLQIGFLNIYKQKKKWEELDISSDLKNLYKNDYKACLIIHSFSWAFMMMLVPTIIYFDILQNSLIWLITFIFNIGIHCVVDNIKANYKCIDLITDQWIHLIQVGLTWIIMLFIVGVI